MDLVKLRFVMAVGALGVVALLSAGVLFFGATLTQTQVVLLTLLASAIVSELKASSAFIFDGVPDKPSTPDQPETAQPKDPA